MKRNEMVKYISEWLLHNAPNTYKGQDTMLLEADASDLLDLMEHLGMQPPKIPVLTLGEVVIRSENKWETDLDDEIKNDIL
jgi:hypothetical protein